MASPRRLEVLVDHAEGAGVSQVAIERIGLLADRARSPSGSPSRPSRAGQARASRPGTAREKAPSTWRAPRSSASPMVAVRSTRTTSSPGWGLLRIKTWLPGRNAGGPLGRCHPGRCPSGGSSPNSRTWKSTDQGNCGPRSRYEPGRSSSSSSIRSPGATRIWASTWGECAGPPMQ